jgi:folate-binding protein YgfZ
MTGAGGPHVAQDDDPRQVIAVTGADRVPFLQGLVTNDVRRLSQGPVYAALLTPQGKYLADFFLVPQRRDGQTDPSDPDTILLDLAASQAPSVLQRLSMYRLRADVRLDPVDVAVTRGTGTPPPGAWADPRHPALGWRHYGAAATGPADIDDHTDWDALRVAHVIPQAGIELIPNESYPLEMGFERLHGIDFRKGCYVGQEVTARMKHKTELRKGLVAVRVEGEADPGTPILTSDGREAGMLHTRAGAQALAYLRLDRAGDGLRAGTAAITLPQVATTG